MACLIAYCGHNKSSAVVEMGDRLATIDIDRKLGKLCLLGELGPHLTQCRQGRAYLHTKWHLDLDPSYRLATVDMGRKLGAVPLLRGS